MSLTAVLLVCAFGLVIITPLIVGKWQALKEQKATLEKSLQEVIEQKDQLKKELSARQKELQLSIEDSVTKLMGGRIFSDRLAHQIRESKRFKATMGIAFVDINHFKMVNDALGPDVGDVILAEIARRLETCIRQVDTLSRFSKDTFVVLLSQLAKPETAAIVAQRILQALARPFQIDGQEINLSACVGLALYPQDGEDAATLLRNADDALQAAKKKGKQVYQFYQEKMQQQSHRELLLYTSMARETTITQFSLLFQPVMNMRDKTIRCLEASFNWEQEELGVIGFDEIVLYAEKQQKLNQVTEALIHRACDQFLRWQGLGFKPQFLSVPMKIRQLESSHFVYRVSQMLQDMSFPCDQLIVSLDENIRPISFDVLEKSFNMLSYLGVKICLNHFGCGGMSLRYLKNLKVDYLKLDQTFIDDVAENDYTKALINSLAMMAEHMGIELIANGVETSEQLSTLNNLNCPLMQGRLIGEALPEMQVESVYHRQTSSTE